MNKHIIYLLLITLGCQPKGSDKNNAENSAWDEEDRIAFIETCQQAAGEFSSEGASGYCDCLLDVLVERYPEPAQTINLGQAEWEELILDSDCHGPEFEEALAVFWGEEAEEAFKKGCETAALKSGSSEEEAERFCSCALEQTKETLPNPHHTNAFTEEELKQIMEACE